MKKITIEIDGWVSLDDGTSKIGLGDIDVDVVIEDRRHTHATIEDHVQCKECAQRACDATSRDMADSREKKLSNMDIKFEGVGTKKVKSDICIVCGFDPKDREKSIGCYHFRTKISNRHQYWHYE